jgi:acetyl-CoA acetyltransferase
MGETAEVLAREYGIAREKQDAFALESHARAVAAHEKLAEELCPVYSPPAKRVVIADNGPRKGQSIEALAKLRPVFDRKNGTVTAGNSSQITDGAAALLVMSEMKAAELVARDGSFAILAELMGRDFEELLAEVLALGLWRLGLA